MIFVIEVYFINYEKNFYIGIFVVKFFYVFFFGNFVFKKKFIYKMLIIFD